MRITVNPSFAEGICALSTSFLALTRASYSRDLRLGIELPKVWGDIPAFSYKYDRSGDDIKVSGSLAKVWGSVDDLKMATEEYLDLLHMGGVTSFEITERKISVTGKSDEDTEVYTGRYSADFDPRYHDDGTVTYIQRPWGIPEVMDEYVRMLQDWHDEVVDEISEDRLHLDRLINLDTGMSIVKDTLAKYPDTTVSYNGHGETVLSPYGRKFDILRDVVKMVLLGEDLETGIRSAFHGVPIIHASYAAADNLSLPRFYDVDSFGHYMSNEYTPVIRGALQGIGAGRYDLSTDDYSLLVVVTL